MNASFIVHAHRFPAEAFLDALRALGAVRGLPSTASHSQFWCVQGKGFDVWIHDVALLDDDEDPPLWSVLIEAKSKSVATERAFDAVVQGVRAFLDSTDLVYFET